MAPWLLWRRWFGSVDYEHELPRLADQISAAQAALAAAKAAQRKWPALFLVQTAAIYASYLLIVVLSKSRQRRFAHQAAVMLVPLLIWAVYRLMKRLFAAVVGRRERLLKGLTDRRKMLVDEYKKKTNFDKIRELIADPSAPESQKAAAAKGGQPAPRRRGSTPRGGSNARGGPVTGQSGAPFTAGPAASAAASAAGADPALGLPATAPGALTAAPYRRTWIDRLVDLVLGENEMSPANRDALICPKCFSHNGLAPFGKSAAEITYRCPVCGYLNVGTTTKSESQADTKTDSSAGATFRPDDANASAKSDLTQSDSASAESGSKAESEDAFDASSEAHNSRGDKPLAPASARASSGRGPDVKNGPQGSGLSDARPKSDPPKVEALKTKSSDRQGSPASPSSESAKSISQHLESHGDDFGDNMTVEERIMKEINDIHKEIADSHASSRADSAENSIAGSSRSSPAA